MHTMDQERLLPMLPQQLPVDRQQHLELQILPLLPTIPHRLEATRNTTLTRALHTQNMTPTRVPLDQTNHRDRDTDRRQDPQHPMDRPHLPATVAAIMNVMGVMDVMDVTDVKDVILDVAVMATIVSAQRHPMEEEIAMAQVDTEVVHTEVVHTAVVSIHLSSELIDRR